MSTISLQELVTQLASKKTATGKEKAEFLEKANNAIEKAHELDEFLSKMINPERMTRMKILEVLSDKKPRGWSQIQSETGLSPSTLSRGLKAMIKDGWVDRVVISKFPPSSVYTINKRMVEAGQIFREIRATIAMNFFAQMTGEFSDEEILKSTRHTLHTVAGNALGLSLQIYKERGYQVTWDMIFYLTYFLLMQFWGLFMSLAETKDLTNKAVEILMDEVKQYEEELKMAKNVSRKTAKNAK